MCPPRRSRRSDPARREKALTEGVTVLVSASKVLAAGSGFAGSPADVGAIWRGVRRKGTAPGGPRRAAEA
jgi:hypothetical protein